MASLTIYVSLGLDVEECGHPEDDRNNPLNVDALFRIDGELWAAEHTRIVTTTVHRLLKRPPRTTFARSLSA